MLPTVTQLLDRPVHAGPLRGAALVGEAAGGERLLVRVGLWLDAAGRVSEARFRATTCPSLVAYAEAACALVEGGRPERLDPERLDPERLRAAVAGVHPLHRDRADLVSLAFQRALAQRARPQPGGRP